MRCNVKWTVLSNKFLNILHLLLLLTYIERCTKTCMRRTGVCTGVCAFKPKLAHKYVPLRESLNHFCYFSVSCKVWWGLQVIQLIRQQSAKVPPNPTHQGGGEGGGEMSRVTKSMLPSHQLSRTPLGCYVLPPPDVSPGQFSLPDQKSINNIFKSQSLWLYLLTIYNCHPIFTINSWYQLNPQCF